MRRADAGGGRTTPPRRDRRMPARPGGAGGFSLLEMVVAIAILALTLGALYQAVGGATRNVRTDERYAYAVELARSLLADNARVPRAGLRRRGQTAGGFNWSVRATPLDLASGRAKRGELEAGALQAIEVSVAWQDGRKRRDVVLHSVVEGIAP
jgi:general secretion pathway protein I